MPAGLYPREDTGRPRSGEHSYEAPSLSPSLRVERKGSAAAVALVVLPRAKASVSVNQPSPRRTTVLA